MRPIFVGGAGRSGTTLVNRLLGRHPKVFALPDETRFIVDPDGLITLVDCLTVRYSAAQSREALYRFERLLKSYLVTPKQTPYFGYDLSRFVDRDFLLARTDMFVAEFAKREFLGADAPSEERGTDRTILQRVGLTLRILPRPGPRKHKLKVVDYQRDRSQLVKAAANFIADIFTRASKGNGKESWSEKTPSNFLHFEFLHELFPHAILLHVKRDPIAVVGSMRSRPWAPESTEAACWYLRSIYDRWFDVKNRLVEQGIAYFEIKFEDLVDAPEQVLREIFGTAGLGAGLDFDLTDVLPERATLPHSEGTAGDRDIVERVLGAHRRQLGYEATR